MPETKLNDESKTILGQILTRAFDLDDQTPFEELLKRCDEIPHTRELALEQANIRVTKLLDTASKRI